jgi:hypothetical protein
MFCVLWSEVTSSMFCVDWMGFRLGMLGVHWSGLILYIIFIECSEYIIVNKCSYDNIKRYLRRTHKPTLLAAFETLRVLKLLCLFVYKIPWTDTPILINFDIRKFRAGTARSVVWLARGWTTGVRFCAGRDFSLRSNVYPGPGAHPISCLVYTGLRFSGLKRPGREGNQWHVSSTDVMNAWSCISTRHTWRDA